MLNTNTEELLAVFRIIESAKDAVERFEQGEINAGEAVRLIIEAASQNRAA